MGPKLTDNEIIEIQNKIDIYYNNYSKPIKKLKFNLIKMKQLYDTAIKKSTDKDNTLKSRYAVEELKNMIMY
jgi:hypothetical protein